MATPADPVMSGADSAKPQDVQGAVEEARGVFDDLYALLWRDGRRGAAKVLRRHASVILSELLSEHEGRVAAEARGGNADELVRADRNDGAGDAGPAGDPGDGSAGVVGDTARTLRAKAAELRATAAHAGANRDDWFCSMPTDVSEGWLADADLFERAADQLAALSSSQARVEEMERALERADRVIGVMSDYVGKMALSADTLSDLNEHWLFMQRAQALSGRGS